MPRSAGRPPRQTEFDEKTLQSARRALIDVANDLRLPRAKYPTPTKRDPQGTIVAPRHLDVAVLAIELAQAFELIAGEHVAKARELDRVTWEDVGEAFGTTMQAAHARFRASS
jgi:hypothetical protein